PHGGGGKGWRDEGRAARLHCAEQAAGSGVGDGGPGRAEDAAKLFARIAGARVPGGEFGVCGVGAGVFDERSEEHTSELQSRSDLVCRLLLEKKKKIRDEL